MDSSEKKAKQCRTYMMTIQLLLAVFLLFAHRYNYSSDYSFCWALAASSSSFSSSSSASASLKRSTRNMIDDGSPVACYAIQSLQSIHPFKSPADVLQELAEFCRQEGEIQKWDMYGDFFDCSEHEDGDDNENAADARSRSTSTHKSSFLRRMEAELATELGKEDALIVPSGTMAQQMTLLIHATSKNDTDNNDQSNNGQERRGVFACHPTSHLLLHEQDSYRQLSGMNALLVRHHHPAKEDVDKDDNNDDDEEGKRKRLLSIPPLLFVDVKKTLDPYLLTTDNMPSTLLLELPHREIGGQLTPWKDVLAMRDYCRQHQIAFHCDGARLFEAAAGYGMTLAELAEPFDTVYLSFYKGLGGMAGSVLLGTKPFIAEARLWLRRFGGNLYTLLPYAVSGYMGYRRYWKLDYYDSSNDKQQQQQSSTNVLSFAEKTAKIQMLVAALHMDPVVAQVVAFHPNPPQTNMVHAYFRNATAADCLTAVEHAYQLPGAPGSDGNRRVRVLHRVRNLIGARDCAIALDSLAYAQGYRSKMEWTMGEANGRIPNEVILQEWREFAGALLEQIHNKTKM